LLYEFQPLFKVVGRGGQLYALVCLFKSNGVYLAHGQVLGKGAKNRFYSGLPFGLQVPALWTSYPGVVALILGAEMRYSDAFLLRLAQAGGFQRTAFADMFTGPVLPLFGFGTVVQEYLFKRNGLALGAAVLVCLLIKCKSFRAACVGAMGRDVAGNPFVL
jgi:hypothetical protein